MNGAHPLALEIADIRAGYGAADVLLGIRLEIPQSGVFALLGPNGAGKTTLMRVISGRLRPSAGSVHHNGVDITGLAPEDVARRGVCTIPEGRGIFPNLTVEENLRMWTLRPGLAFDDVRSAAYTRFPKLQQRRRQTAGTLSGGEQQMLAISRALTTHPSVILFDEVSMGLAPVVVEEMYEIIARLAGGGQAILIVEQFAEIALEIATWAAVLRQGRIVFSGAPRDVEAQVDELYFGASPA